MLATPTTADLGHRLSCRQTATLRGVGTPLPTGSRSITVHPLVAVWGVGSIVARSGSVARATFGISAATTVTIRITTVRNRLVRSQVLRTRAGANVAAVRLS